MIRALDHLLHPTKGVQEVEDLISKIKGEADCTIKSIRSNGVILEKIKKTDKKND